MRLLVHVSLIHLHQLMNFKPFKTPKSYFFLPFQSSNLPEIQLWIINCEEPFSQFILNEEIRSEFYLNEIGRILCWHGGEGKGRYDNTLK